MTNKLMILGAMPAEFAQGSPYAEIVNNSPIPGGGDLFVTNGGSNLVYISPPKPVDPVSIPPVNQSVVQTANESCPGCENVHSGNTAERATREDLFKYHVAVYKESLVELYGNSAEGVIVSNQLTSIIGSDLTASVSISGLKDWVNEKVDQFVDAVKVVVKQAGELVEKVVELPIKFVLDVIMKVLGGKFSFAFLYSFIPDSSTLLKNAPAIASKRTRQKDVVAKLAKAAGMEENTLYQHMRNAIIKAYGKSPEMLINERAGLSADQIGFDPATDAAIGAGLLALIAAVPEIVKSFGKKNAPAAADYPTGNTNQTNTNTNTNTSPTNTTQTNTNNGGNTTPDKPQGDGSNNGGGTQTNQDGLVDPGQPKEPAFFDSTAGKVVKWTGISLAIFGVGYGLKKSKSFLNKNTK